MIICNYTYYFEVNVHICQICQTKLLMSKTINYGLYGLIIKSDNLLKCVLFGGVVAAVVTAHKSLKRSKGVVRNWELAMTDPEEIEQNVPMITDVQRIVVKRNNMGIHTNTLILTFNKFPIH